MVRIVNGFAPAVNEIVSIAVLVATETSVTVDIPNVATSVGTIFGIQLAAVFQSLLTGFMLQVALSA